MATINRARIGTLNDRITITVKEEDYDPGFQKSLKQYSKNANIPGFRKGKVPVSLIKKMYGASLFPEEVLKAVESGLNDYLKKEQLDLFGQPILQPDADAPKVDVNNPGDYSFDFEIGLKPEVDLKALQDNLKFTRYKVQPESKEVAEEIEKLQLRAATFEELDAVADDDNVLTVSFRPAAEAEAADAEAADTHEDKFQLKYFSPKTQKKLKGKKKTDSLSLPLKDIFEEKELDWVIGDWKLDKATAPEETYSLTLEKIEKPIPRKLEEDFFKEVFPDSEITTEEAFREKVAEEMAGQWAHQAKHMLEHEIFEKLVSDTPIELPVDFLKKQLQTEDGKLKTEEEVAAAYPEFEKQTRWGLITSAIIQAENLDATPDEVKGLLQQQVMGYFNMQAVSPESESMIGELTNRLMQDEKRIDEAYRTILTNKLFDWLTDKADITEKELSTEAFTKIVNEHNHEHHEH